MKNIFKNFPMGKDLAALGLRLTFGLSMLFAHGMGKAEKLFGDAPIKFADVMGMGQTASLSLAVFAEVLCAALVALGLFTRLAVIPLLITMLVALLVIHGSDPFGKQEMSLLYGTAYTAILFLGPGRFSLDTIIRNKR